MRKRRFENAGKKTGNANYSTVENFDKLVEQANELMKKSPQILPVEPETIESALHFRHVF